ncbi:hypothetical protein GN958_ATG08054, partial [Phytophthora infestans]
MTMALSYSAREMPEEEAPQTAAIRATCALLSVPCYDISLLSIYTTSASGEEVYMLWCTSDIDEDNMRVHLIYFSMDAKTNNDLVLGGYTTSERAPYLASIGDGCLLLVWEGSSTSGNLDEKVTVGCKKIGDRYQSLTTFPGGDVAYQSIGTTSTTCPPECVSTC